MSHDNPYDPPAAAFQSHNADEDRDRLRRIASAQRQVNVAVLLYLAMISLSIVITSVGDRAAPPVAIPVAILFLIYSLIVLIWGAISVYRLASIFRGPFIAVIHVLGLLVPLLGLVLLYVNSRKATKALRKSGVTVGLLGANPSAI